jgi:hypothetical protein
MFKKLIYQNVFTYTYFYYCFQFFFFYVHTKKEEEKIQINDFYFIRRGLQLIELYN